MWFHWVERHHLAAKHRVGRLAEWRRFQAAHLPIESDALGRLQEIEYLKTVTAPTHDDLLIMDQLFANVNADAPGERQPLVQYLFFGIAELLVHWVQLKTLDHEDVFSKNQKKTKPKWTFFCCRRGCNDYSVVGNERERERNVVVYFLKTPLLFRTQHLLKAVALLKPDCCAFCQSCCRMTIHV